MGLKYFHPKKNRTSILKDNDGANGKLKAGNKMVELAFQRELPPTWPHLVNVCEDGLEAAVTE